MTRLPHWCNQGYLERFVGGCMSIVNYDDDHRYHGQIATVELRHGNLQVTFDWLAIGVDENNCHSIDYEGGWVQATSLEHKVPLYVPANPLRVGDHDMLLYTVIADDSDGLLGLEGGGVMNQTLAFIPAGMSLLQQSQIRPHDPENPVGESRRPLDGNPVAEVWEVGADGRQRLRETIFLPRDNSQ